MHGEQELTKIRFHDLRHTAASLIINRGIRLPWRSVQGTPSHLIRSQCVKVSTASIVSIMSIISTGIAPEMRKGDSTTMSISSQENKCFVGIQPEG